MRSTAIMVLMVSAAVCQEAAAEPPKIVRTVPANGATVEASLSAIRVIFDQDMDSSSYSWTGGGPSFPKPAGKPRWNSSRECILPVQPDT
jgi:hypothetical protein